VFVTPLKEVNMFLPHFVDCLVIYLSLSLSVSAELFKKL